MKNLSYFLFLLTIFSVVSVNSFKIRARQDPSQGQCTLSCFSVVDEVLPGDTIGFRTIVDGGHFSYEQSTNAVFNCCSQNRTFNGYRIPDFQEVSVLNIPDEMDIQVDISQAVKNENQTSDYLISITHQFQRQALNLTIPENKLTANLTTADELEVDFENCNRVMFPWYVEYNFLGEEVYTSQILGVYQNITVEFYTNSTSYHPQQVADIYFAYIQTHSLSTIMNVFPDSELKSYGTKSIGGKSLLDFSNWPSYVTSLNTANYVFTKVSISDNGPSKFSAMDSYLLFDQMDATSRQCALNEWQFKFHKVTPITISEIARQN